MKLIEVIRKYLPIWVAFSILLALFIGYYEPEVRNLKLIIPFLLFLMLYPMMINLRVEDLSKALSNLKLVSIAIIMNFLFTPIMGAIWTHIFLKHTNPFLAIGFILKVTVPCSGMVTAWTGYAKGRIESALIIVALSLILAIFLVPLWMWILAGTYVTINPLIIFKKMLLIVVIPLIAGMSTRKLLIKKYGIKRYKQNIAPYFPAISTCGMLLMVFVIISSQAKLIISNIHWIILIIIGIATLYPLLFTIAIIIAKLLHIDYEDAMALGYSVTAKNHAITIGIATTTFGGTLAVLPAAVAPIIQIPVMLLYLNLSKKIKSFLSA